MQPDNAHVDYISLQTEKKKNQADLWSTESYSMNSHSNIGKPVLICFLSSLCAMECMEGGKDTSWLMRLAA